MTHLHLILSFLIFLLSLLAAVLRISWVIAENFRAIDKKLSDSIATTKGEFEARLSIFEKSHEDRIIRVYERFDEYKKRTEATCVSKEMCGVMHNTTSQQLTEMNIRMGNMERKIDRIIEKHGIAKE